MPITAAPPGVTIGTAATTIYQNPANSGVYRTVEVQFANYDGINDADIAYCQWVDASAGGAANPILPYNYPLKAKVGLVAIRKVLEPGDAIRAAASAAGDIWAVVDIVFTEPAS